MKVKTECPFGKYGQGMKIVCTRDEKLCAFQYYRQCKGWYANTESAAGCLKRKENN